MIKKLNGISPDIGEECFVAENATVIGDVEIKNNSSIWYGAVLRGDVAKIIIGEKTNIQDNTVIHCSTDIATVIGNGITIGHSVIIHSSTIKDNCIIGMGTTILDNTIIGENSIIGANSFISKGKVIPPGVIAYGNPIKVIRPLTKEEIENNKLQAEHYCQNAKRHFSNNDIDM